MNEFEKNVMQQISLLDDELKGLTERRKVVEAKIAGLRMFLSASAVRAEALDISLDVQAVSVLPKAPKVAVKDKVLEAALRILADGKPRRTSDLVAEFFLDGIEVGGTNQTATVSSILSRDHRFKADRTHGWSLTKKESPAGNEAFDLQPTP